MSEFEEFITRVVRDLGGTITIANTGGQIQIDARAMCDGVERHVQVRCGRLDYVGRTLAFREATADSIAGLANSFWTAKPPA